MNSLAMNKPYAFINDRMQTYTEIKNRLGGNSKFDALNAHIRNIIVVPGQVVIVGDPSTQNFSPDEVELTSLARNVFGGLVHNGASSDGSAIKNFDVLQQMLDYGSIGIGAATGSWSKHLDGVKNTLEDIERLYKLSLARGTPIARQEFISQRRALFTKLEKQLEGVARWGSGLHDRGSIKKMLGISTKSYLHTGEIRGYAKRIGGVAKAANLLKKGTAVGIGLNVASTALEIKEACSVGRDEVCAEAKYVEGAKLAGGLAGGSYVGGIGAASGSALCVAVFGIPSLGLGALGCGIIGGALGAFGGGLAGEAVGEGFGSRLFEWRP
jgi:hypothetical protein